MLVISLVFITSLFNILKFKTSDYRPVHRYINSDWRSKQSGDFNFFFASIDLYFDYYLSLILLDHFICSTNTRSSMWYVPMYHERKKTLQICQKIAQLKVSVTTVCPNQFFFRCSPPFVVLQKQRADFYKFSH